MTERFMLFLDVLGFSHPETLLDASNAVTRAVGSMLGLTEPLTDVPLVEDKG